MTAASTHPRTEPRRRIGGLRSLTGIGPRRIAASSYVVAIRTLVVCILLAACVAAPGAGAAPPGVRRRPLPHVPSSPSALAVVTVPPDAPELSCWKDLSFEGRIRVRVRLEDGRNSIEVWSSSPWRVEAGAVGFEVPARTSCVFAVESARPALRVYRLGVDVVDVRDGVAALHRSLAYWRRAGLDVYVMAAGARLLLDGRLVNDNRRWYVVARGDYASREDALAAAAALPSPPPGGVKPWPLECELQPASGTIRVEAGFSRRCVTAGPLRLEPGRSPLVVRRVEYGRGCPWHGFKDMRFGGVLEVSVDPAGLLRLVEETSLENLVAGIVPSEMPASYPPEALKAQAVCARSELVAKLRTRHLVDPFDFCAAQHCQVYRGLCRDERVLSAVRATAGVVLLRERGRVLDAVYCACCGGHTENVEVVWSTKPVPCLVGVWDSVLAPALDLGREADLAAWLAGGGGAWCARRGEKRGVYRWKRRIPQERLMRLLAAAGRDVGRVLRIDVLSRGVSGRVERLAVVGERGSFEVEKELEVRRLFGGLKSAMFVVRPVFYAGAGGGAAQGAAVPRAGKTPGAVPSSFVFVGGGWGHGVGMCQYGARGMAEAGRSWRDILLHYFRGALPERIARERSASPGR